MHLLLWLSLLAGAAPPEATVTRPTVAGLPVVVVRPAGPGPWPVVFQLGGMGELSRGPAAAAGAWVDDYALLPALRALHGGRLDARSFRGLTEPRLLRAYKRRLARGYRGLVLVGVPAPVDYSTEFERWFTEKLLPWTEATLPIRPGAAHRGIDGVSLGGRHALRLGLRHPHLFRTVGTEQPAVRGWQDPLLELAAARPTAARALTLNLLTSRDDPYRPAVGRLAKAFRAAGLKVRHAVVPGPHSYEFNRGPGVIDLLLFHDAVLNGTCPPTPFPIPD